MVDTVTVLVGTV